MRKIKDRLAYLKADLDYFWSLYGEIVLTVIAVLIGLANVILPAVLLHLIIKIFAT